MWFYFKEGQRTGPMTESDLAALIRGGALNSETLVWEEGMVEWQPLGTIPLGKHLQPGISTNRSSPAASPPPLLPRFCDAVKHRDPISVAIFTAVSVGLYWAVYLVPAHAQDLEAITKRQRINFAAACILGIITLGVFPAVLTSIYAFELERAGVDRAVQGRQQSLGAQITALLAACYILVFFSGGLAFLVCVAINSYVAYAMQKEINLYAKSR